MKITLTIPEPLAKKIKAEKEQDSYFSLQEVILNTLRQKYHTTTTNNNTTRAGRPKRFHPEDLLTKKRIFTKRGTGRIDL